MNRKIIFIKTIISVETLLIFVLCAGIFIMGQSLLQQLKMQSAVEIFVELETDVNELDLNDETSSRSMAEKIQILNSLAATSTPTSTDDTRNRSAALRSLAENNPEVTDADTGSVEKSAAGEPTSTNGTTPQPTTNEQTPATESGPSADEQRKLDVLHSLNEDQMVEDEA